MNKKYSEICSYEQFKSSLITGFKLKYIFTFRPPCRRILNLDVPRLLFVTTSFNSLSYKYK